jgi:hypothetical protein
MTVSSPTNRVLSFGNGVTTTWPFSFPVTNAAHLVVIVTDASGNVSTLTATQYSVSGIGSPAGGAVTYPLSGSPLASGGSILIKRVVPYTQTADVQNQGGFYPDVIEGGFDQIVFQTQQLADVANRSLVVPDGETGLTLPALASRASTLLGFNSQGLPIPVNPSTVTPSDTLGITHEGQNLAAYLNSSISLAPAEIISIVGNTTLDLTGINRAIYVTGSATTVTLNMPPVTGSNVGDQVLVIVDPAFPGLLTCTAFPASGVLFGGQPNRVLHAGETALVRYTGTDWQKILGNSRPLFGMMSNSAAIAAVASPTWTSVPTPVTDADNEPSKPWFVTDHFVCPRNSLYRFDLQMWVDNITMTAPNYAAPNGNEQGLPVDIGFTSTFGVSPIAASFDRFLVHYGQTYQAFNYAWQVFAAASTSIGATFRPGAAALTAIRATYVNSQILTRVTFQEIVQW